MVNGIAVTIDAVDGTFARLVGVKEVLPIFDGALLDNIVDYLNYVVTPCFFILTKQKHVASCLELFDFDSHHTHFSLPILSKRC